MTLAQIGPLTTVLEAAAAAVGAGVVLSSVAVGVAGLASRMPRRNLESRALVGGYFGGGVGAVVAVVDAILRYGGLK